MQIAAVFKKFLFFLQDVIFPAKCLICGQDLLPPRENDYHLCPACVDKVVPLKGKRCKKCSMPLISENEICTRCRKQAYHFHRNHSLFAYRDIVKELLYYYKFKAKQRLSLFFAGHIQAHLETMGENSPLIPVPSRPGNIRKRGWDHVKTISRVLKKRYGLDILYCLQRKGGLTQKELNIEDRFKNIRGKIICLHPEKLQGRHKVVLLDDIFTTGATADECARVLLNQGVKEVSVLTIALD